MTDLQTDSRLIQPGDTFVAQKGLTVNGHDFISQAIANGAAAVIAQYHSVDYADAVPLEINAAPLWKIAQAHYSWDDLKVIGVTGTNGKTSTTHILYELLQASGVKCGLIGTNRIMIDKTEAPANKTTPDALELAKLFSKMNNKGCQFCVMEVSSHALDQGRVGGVQFDIAAFTNLSPEHLDWHGTMQQYFDSKLQLFKQSDKSIILVDSDYGRKMASKVSELDTHIIKVGSAEQAKQLPDYLYDKVELLPDRVRFDLVHSGKSVNYVWNTPGAFSVQNAALALSIYSELGMNLDEAAKFLVKTLFVKGRMETFKLANGVTAVIDYAHSPDALEKSILTLKESVPGKLVVLFGCGGDRDRVKRPLMGQIAAKYADYTFLTSDNPRTEDPAAILDEIESGFLSVLTNESGTKPPFERIENRVDAIKRAVELAAELGSDPKPATVLLAGKGQETYQEINGVKHHLDEREVLLGL